MSEDIIEKIDAALLAEANSKRFDPLGENWDNNETDPWTSGDAMRRRPASAGSEEEHEPAEAAPQHTVVAFPLSSASLFEPGGGVSITLPASAPVMYVVSFVDTAGDAEFEPEAAAPTDRVADAMRSEVLRQGLATCEIDGVPQEYRDGNWTIIDETHAFSRLYLNEMVWGRIEPEGPIHHGPGSFSDVSSRSLGQTWARTAGPQAYWPEPVGSPVDAAVQPEMSECRNDSDISTRPWWRRIWSRTPPTLLPPSPTEGSTGGSRL